MESQNDSGEITVSLVMDKCLTSDKVDLEFAIGGTLYALGMS